MNSGVCILLWSDLIYSITHLSFSNAFDLGVVGFGSDEILGFGVEVDAAPPNDGKSSTLPRLKSGGVVVTLLLPENSFLSLLFLPSF